MNIKNELYAEVQFYCALDDINTCFKSIKQFKESVNNINELYRVSKKYNSLECLTVISDLSNNALVGVSMEEYHKGILDRVIDFFKMIGVKIKNLWRAFVAKITSFFSSNAAAARSTAVNPFNGNGIALFENCSGVTLAMLKDSVEKLSNELDKKCSFQNITNAIRTGNIEEFKDLCDEGVNESYRKLKEAYVAIKDRTLYDSGIVTKNDSLEKIENNIKDRIKTFDRVIKDITDLTSRLTDTFSKLRKYFEAIPTPNGSNYKRTLANIADLAITTTTAMGDAAQIAIVRLTEDCTNFRKQFYASTTESLDYSSEGIYGVGGQHKLLKSIKKSLGMKLGGQLKGYLLDTKSMPDIRPWTFMDIDDSFEFTKKVYATDKRLSATKVDHYFIARSGSDALCVDSKDMVYKYTRSGDTPFTRLNRKLNLYLCSKDRNYARELQRQKFTTGAMWGAAFGMPVAIGI